ncbi:hypothetical protein [Aliiroseovarius sp.]|uniref:hypothetical protein n=1 Tax=Aliiroseovarius sp. TaxID=1872442 RepID=UPI003BA9C4B8
MTRLVVHSGFHGPDTAALNRLVHHNHHELRAAGLEVLHRAYMIGLEAAVERSATANSRYDPVWGGRSWAERALTAEAIGDARAVILTGKGLAGRMPGWRDVIGYDHLPPAIEGVAQGLAEAGHDIALHYTLCPPEVFLDHCHWTLLTGAAIAMTRDAFWARYHAAADLIGMVERIRARLDPIPVTWAMIDGEEPNPTPLYHAAGLDPKGIVDLLPPPRRRRRGYDPALEQEILALHDSPNHRAMIDRISDLLREAE